MAKREELRQLVDTLADPLVDKVYEYARAVERVEPSNSPGRELTDEDLDELAKVTESATPGPWFVRELDDSHAMCLVAISNVKDERNLRWPKFDPGEIIAATLVQEPRYVDHSSENWDDNAAFIAIARSAMPKLIAEVRFLRSIGNSSQK